MQTTLLGVAIAMILALVSALVAPLVVDWSRYRSVFEQEASRLTGLDVRVNGTIDARILPSPRIKLRDVEFGAAAHRPQMQAEAIDLEVGLGPLLRGEIRATDLRLVAPQITLGLDRSGAIDWPALSPSLHPEAIAVAHLNVEDGRITLADARSGARLVLQKLWFNGDIGSVIGPFKGEGAFVVGDELYGYRLSGSRLEDDGGLKVRLGIDPANHPLTAEIEGTLNFDSGVPRFEGTLALARPVGAALADGERVMSDPWQLTGTVRASSASASLNDLALQYGPDERAINFSGKGELTFGAHPRLDGTIAARRLDIDRALAAPDVTHRLPFVMLKSFFAAFVAAVKPPLPVAVGVAVDAVTVGGTTIQSLRGDVRFDRGWSVHDFAFRAPGFTEVRLSGRLDDSPQGPAFSGPASLESADLKTLMAWLEGRNEPPSGLTETLTARGDVTIAGDRLALDRLSATLDQEKVEGRLAYTWAANDRPAALDGELHAAQLNLDALTAFAKATMLDDAFAMPRQVALALDVGKVTLAGVDARAVNARVKFDAGILHIDRLSIGDLGGTALAVSGRLDELSSQPRGRLTLDLTAAALGGLTDIMGKFAPRTADWLRRFADRLAPAKLHGTLTVDRAAAGTAANLNLAGDVGALRVALDGEAKGDPAHPGDATARLESRLDADDGGALVRLLDIDRVLAVDQLPGELTVSAAGPLNGDIHINGLAVAGGFSAAVEGELRLSGERAPTGSLQVKMSAADLRPLHTAMTGQPGLMMPVTAHSTLAIAGANISFTDLAATVGKASLHGRLALKLSNPIGIDGAIAGGDVDAAAVSMMLLGLPSAAPGATASWSTAPIGAGAFAPLDGTVTFKFDRAAFTPAVVVRELDGVARFQPSQIALRDINGSLAGGRLTGELTFRRDARELAAQAHLALADADAAALLAADKASDKNAMEGLLTVQLQGEGLGGSPDGLIGSLHGSGSIALNNVRFAGFDPAAFAVAVHVADQSGAIEAPEIRAAVSAVMEKGRLTVENSNADLTIAAGQIRLAEATLQAQDGAELAIDGLVDLNDATIDAHLTLSAQPAPNALIRARPELAVRVKGSMRSPQRMLDVSTLVSWLTLRAAELQTRRLESIEANRREEVLGTVARPASPSIRMLPPGTPLESAIRTNAAPLSALSTRGFDRLLPEPPAAPAAVPDGRSEQGDEHDTTAVASPAPLGIKPVAPPQAPRTDNATATAGAAVSDRPRPPAPPPAPPTVRSLLDRLFRPQN